MKFHEFVRLRRIKCHLGTAELARQASISDAEISHIEAGTRIPNDLVVLTHLADALQLDREWFRNFAHIKANLFINIPK